MLEKLNIKYSRMFGKYYKKEMKLKIYHYNDKNELMFTSPASFCRVYTELTCMN